MAFEGVSQVINPVHLFVNALKKIIVCKYGWLLVALKNIMINKKIAKQYKDLLKTLNQENNNIQERTKRNNKIRENLILRSLEDKKD